MSRERFAALRSLAAHHDVGAVLLHNRLGDSRYLRWLFGLGTASSCNYVLVVREQELVFELSFRAADLRASGIQAPVLEVAEEAYFGRAIAEQLSGVARLGVAGDAPFHQVLGLPCEVVDISAAIAPLLARKAADEIELISQEASNLHRMVARIGMSIDVAMSEREIAQSFQRALIDVDAQESFNTSVVSGDRLRTSTLGVPSERVVGTPGSVCIDCGTRRNGLITDITRMFFVGDSDVREGYGMLVEAHERVIRSLRPNCTVSHISALYRTELTKAGLDADSLVLPELGHGLGFALHEPPYIALEEHAEWRMEVGSIFTLEPEICFRGVMIRVEDMLVMNDVGAQILTRS